MKAHWRDLTAKAFFAGDGSGPKRFFLDIIPLQLGFVYFTMKNIQEREVNRSSISACTAGLIVIVLMFAVGCNKKGEELESPLAPPSFIQGTWNSEKGDSGLWKQWIFTADNAIYNTHGNEDFSAINFLQKYLNWDEDSYGKYVLLDIFFETHYEIREYSQYYANDNRYHFAELTPTTLLYTSTTNGKANGDPIVFTKQ